MRSKSPITGHRKVETDGHGGATIKPASAEYSLTEGALSPVQAEPTHNKVAEHYRKSGRQSDSFFAEMAWPETQVRLFLKNRKRTISLHDMSDFIGMPKDARFAYRVLLGDAESIAQRLRESAVQEA